MPTVLLTGITGFLSAHVALAFLKHGWNVRGTLRSDSKRSAVLAIPEYAPYVSSGQLSLYAVGDLSEADYSEAIKGVDAVVHTASPVEFGDKEFRQSHLAPALEGTTKVLEAAAKEGSIKAVVYTSTYGAVGDQRAAPTEQVGKVVTEEDWNPYTLEELDKIVETGDNGGNPYGTGALFYMGAKKYAELAAWDVQKSTKGEWSLATMNCVMIFGPPNATELTRRIVHPLSSLSDSGLSVVVFWALMQGKEKPIMPTMFPYYVDVRDAAEAHYQAIVRQAQGRFTLSAGPFDYQEVADNLRTWYPAQKDRFALGTPGKYDYKEPGVYTLKNDKSKKELGIEYRPKDETFKDAVERIFELEKAGLK